MKMLISKKGGGAKSRERERSQASKITQMHRDVRIELRCGVFDVVKPWKQPENPRTGDS